MSGRTFVLRTDNARDRMAAAWQFACEFLEIGERAKVTVDEFKSKRSLEQNSMFHAICGELAKQKQWAGVWLDTEAWKRLLVDAWARHEGQSQGRVVPSLDGASVVSLGIQTRSMKVADMADLITFAQWYCAENEVDCSGYKEQEAA